MNYVIGSDHGGYALKEVLKSYLLDKNFEFEDFGTHSPASCNYPEIAEKVARAIAEGRYDMGILVCGTGIGMSISANKISGIRAAAVTEAFGAKYSRLHNDANILCLGERITGPGAACEIAELFLKTPFEGGRHATRVEMIKKLEKA